MAGKGGGADAHGAGSKAVEQGTRLLKPTQSSASSPGTPSRRRRLRIKTTRGDIVQVRNFVRSEFSREIQETTCNSYKNRMFSEGLSFSVSGGVAIRWSGPGRPLPGHCGTANHRIAAFYRALKEQPTNPVLQTVLKRGLEVRSMSHMMPDKMWSRYITQCNTYNKGSSNTFLEYAEEVLTLESDFSTSRRSGGSNFGLSYENNSKYLAKYQEFVNKHSQYFAGRFQLFQRILSLMHLVTRESQYPMVWNLGLSWRVGPG